MTEWLTLGLLGIVEGITEFLPVSSTGHLVLVAHLLGYKGEQAKTFELFIQLGAMLAVVLLYRDTFLSLVTGQRVRGLPGRHALMLLTLTTLPFLASGYFLYPLIKGYLLDSPLVVAIGFGVGGMAIIALERWRPRVRCATLGGLLWQDALMIGLFQCLAMWPGMSRSGSTILGAMLSGVERKVAAEYSFLCAVPALSAAVFYDLWKSRAFLHTEHLPGFALGFIVAFLTAALTVRVFIRFVGSHTLSIFGWYRLVMALIIVWLLQAH